MDQEKADSINGVAIDWETIQELDLSKGLNTKEEAIGYILEAFFVVDEEGMPLTELIEQPVFQYIEADFKDVKAAIKRTFGKENLVLKGRNKEWHVRMHDLSKYTVPISFLGMAVSQPFPQSFWESCTNIIVNFYVGCGNRCSHKGFGNAVVNQTIT